MSTLTAINSFGPGVRVRLAAGDNLAVPKGISITSTDAFAVTAKGSSHTITVAGLVTGETGGVALTGGNLENQSLIIAAGGLISSTGVTVSIAAGHARLENHGSISAETNAVAIGTDQAVTDAVIDNAGAIQGAVIAVTTKGIVFANSGSITATVPGDAAVKLSGGAALLTNDGTINGSVQLTDAADQLTNHGSISGTVDLGAGDDRFDNRDGVVSGAIGLGAGNDLYIVGTAHGRIDGGTGYDTLDFSSGASVSIALDRSRVSGGSALPGSYFNFEAAIGSDIGRDQLIGSADDNRLDGRGGKDTLTGKAGADTLLGGAGDDTLTGGSGRDLCTGGAGADTFVFGQGDFGGVTRAMGDRITDFRPRQADKIDLSAVDANSLMVGDQAFTFISREHFHHRAGELRLILGTHETTLFGDTDGDAIADFRIVLDGHINLHAADIVF